MTLYFVVTEDDTGDEKYPYTTNYWIVLADSAEQVREMMNDDCTRVISVEDDVTNGLIDQYGGMAMLCTP